jgi:peptidyl-prolyl cis-trans isomerase B (cyclophilin B)
MQLKIYKFLVTLVVVGALTLGGCSTPQANSNSASPTSTATEASTTTTIATTTATTTEAATETTSVSPNSSENIPGMNDLPRLEGKATVVISVKGSPITIEVDGTNAPITAGNFVDLVQRGVYDGLAFHRVVRSPSPFVVQGGDPKGNGTGGFIDKATGTERRIPLEIKPQDASEPIYGKTLKESGVTKPPVLTHKLGAVAMARSQLANSASSQFYFALADIGFLDGDYAVFGYVTDGMAIVDKIQQGDKIESAKVTSGNENLKNGGK